VVFFKKGRATRQARHTCSAPEDQVMSKSRGKLTNNNVTLIRV